MRRLRTPTIASVDGAEEGRRGVEKAGGFSRRSSGASESMLVSENRSVMSEEKVAGWARIWGFRQVIWQSMMRSCGQHRSIHL